MNLEDAVSKLLESRYLCHERVLIVVKLLLLVSYMLPFKLELLTLNAILLIVCSTSAPGADLAASNEQGRCIFVCYELSWFA